MNRDLLLYLAHTAFWASFGVTKMLRPHAPAPTEAPAPVTDKPVTAPYSRAMLSFHMVAFGLMYFGIGNSVIPNRVPAWFSGQRIAGTLVIAGGAALACWALVWFQSWRFRAQLDAGHQLATGGPFAFVRHPIYAALNLLAIGSAVWVPTTTMWIAAALMAVGSDLRGRAEERILTEAFGARYQDYMKVTCRFLPGIY